MPRLAKFQPVQLNEIETLKLSVKRGTCWPRRFALYCREQYLDSTPNEANLLAYLLTHRGRIIPYWRLLRVLASTSPRGEHQMSSLREYMLRLRRLLAKYHVQAVIVVAEKTGYGLCELVSNRARRVA